MKGPQTVNIEKLNRRGILLCGVGNTGSRFVELAIRNMINGKGRIIDMALTSKALLLRLNTMRKEAIKEFASNQYVTIHDYRYSLSEKKKDPLTVWIDLNYPVYVLKNGTPILKKEVKDVCIRFDSEYPYSYPKIIFPDILASVHSWNNKFVAPPVVYNPHTYNLINVIKSIMLLAANCPEGINTQACNPGRREVLEWTNKSFQNGTLPTVTKSELLKNMESPKRRRLKCEEK